MRSHLLWCLLLFVIGGFGSPVRAAPPPAPSCTLSSPGINFTNAYDPTSATAVTIIGTVTFTCTYTGTGFTANLAISTGTSGSFATRTMKLGPQILNYNLYVDTGYSQIFGDGTGGSYYYTLCYPGGGVSCGAPNGLSGCFAVSGVSGQAEPCIAYGKLPAGQDVSAGTYTDSITATLTF